VTRSFVRDYHETNIHRLLFEHLRLCSSNALLSFLAPLHFHSSFLVMSALRTRVPEVKSTYSHFKKFGTSPSSERPRKHACCGGKQMLRLNGKARSVWNSLFDSFQRLPKTSTHRPKRPKLQIKLICDLTLSTGYELAPANELAHVTSGSEKANLHSNFQQRRNVVSNHNILQYFMVVGLERSEKKK
jgi:hypothetical protein